MRAFGRYELLSPIATGGMAEVWRARAAGPAGVQKEVALKLVRGEHGARSDFTRMFVEEARLAARLSHANVVQVFELVEEGGRHAIAMELVRGHDLARVLERCRETGVRLGLPRAVQIGVEVARALDYAHRLADGERPLGLVHRDVSPHNVLVSLEGEVKLTDFGIARAMGQAGLTDPGQVKGKLAYMAPEQARGEAVDARADVFALGVILWELCAGRRLFARDTDAATLAALLGSDPPSPPSAWNEAVPPGLDAAVLAALERDPTLRTGSAGELGAALSAVLLGLVRTPEEVDLRAVMRRLWPEGEGSGGACEATAVRPAAPEVVEPSVTRTLAEAGSSPPVRRLARFAAAGLAVAALVVVGATLALRAGPQTTPRAGGSAVAPASAAPSAAPQAAPAAAEAPVLAVDPAVDASSAARGEGRISVAVHPWASLVVDGQPVGETPQELHLPAGSHRLRAIHPSFGAAEVEVVVEAGRHVSWHPVLSR